MVKKEKKLIASFLNRRWKIRSTTCEKEKFKNGKYELVFYIGDYFKKITNWMNCHFLMM